MKKIIDFLTMLDGHNTREWFETHKVEYNEALQEFNSFTQRLIDAIASFDPTVRGLSVKDCTYRIYRDIRFSRDKRPYKNHMGAYICRGGKKSGYAGYYFHIEPSGNGMIGSNIISAGLYMPDPKVLKSMRDEIYGNGQEFENSIKKAKNFNIDMGNSLKRIPAGFPNDSEYSDYLKLKDFYLMKRLPNEYLLTGNLLNKLIEELRNTLDFINITNRAVEFAYEEM